MFAFFPFEEQRAHIEKNRLSFNSGEMDTYDSILCRSHVYSPIFDTAPYRIFALAELCLVRILLRERGAMLNMVQYEIASDALQSLVKATVSAHALYAQQKAAAENARIAAEKEAAAAKKEAAAAKKVTVKKVAAKKAAAAKKGAVVKKVAAPVTEKVTEKPVAKKVRITRVSPKIGKQK